MHARQVLLGEHWKQLLTEQVTQALSVLRVRPLWHTEQTLLVLQLAHPTVPVQVTHESPSVLGTIPAPEHAVQSPAELHVVQP